MESTLPISHQNNLKIQQNKIPYKGNIKIDYKPYFIKIQNKKIDNSGRFVGSYTIATYNVLAQSYVEREHYPESPAKVLNKKWRYNQLLKEIVEFNPDIICMQELEDFKSFFKPELEKVGYGGIYAARTGWRRDGCGIFFKIDKFTLVKDKQISLNKLAHEQVKNPSSYIKDTVAIMAILKLNLEIDNPPCLCVSTTHIYWMPKLVEVKIRQVQMILYELSKFTNEHGLNENRTILCGDFNSTPISGIYHYINNGNLDIFQWDRVYLDGNGLDTLENLQLYLSKREYKNTSILWNQSLQDRRNQFQSMVQNDDFYSTSKLVHSFDFKSIYSHYSNNNEPLYTSYANRFKGCVDYIFLTKDLIPRKILSLPKENKDLKQLRGIPNFKWASDHFMLFGEFDLYS